MTPLAIAVFIVVVTFTDLFIIGALFANLRASMWGPLAAAFPPQPPARDAVRKEFQSISVGLFNLGFCVHLTVDEDHLHIDPTAFLRWFRLTKMSIPWNAVRVTKRSRSGRRAAIRVRNVDMQGPAWAFGLAEPVE